MWAGPAPGILFGANRAYDGGVRDGAHPKRITLSPAPQSWRVPLAALALALPLAGCGPSAPQHRGPTTQSLSGIAPRAEERECLATLGARRISFEPLPDRYLGNGCAAINTVHVFSLGTDESDIPIGNLSQVSCPMAAAFASWVRFGVDRAARSILGSPLARIETMGAYSCRTIAGTERLSSHATASAIDVSGFVLADGRRITVAGDWYGGSVSERAFLRAIHESACLRFGTILGPDYNPAHRNHFHIEHTARGLCR